MTAISETLPFETRCDLPAVKLSFIVTYVLAYAGVMMVLLLTVSATLALKIAAIAPQNKETTLGWILGAGAFVALVANPLCGQWSDRTKLKAGRRRPWIIGGMVAGAIAIGFLAMTNNPVVVGIAWCFAQFAFNATLAALIAVLPDQVPAHQRGQLSAYALVAMQMATMGGYGLVSIAGENGVGMFALPTAVGLCAVLLFALTFKDRPKVGDRQIKPWRLRDIASTFWVNPFRFPDFGWTWLSRFLVMLAFAFLMAYQVYYLIDGLGIAAANVPGKLLNVQLATFVVAAPSALVLGWISDRVGRRKIFVLATALVFTVGVTTIVSLPTYSGFMTGFMIAAIGFGAYGAIDQALVVDVLPNSETEAAKNMGVFNIANTVPQSLAPALAPIFLAIGSTGQNYTMLFTVAAVVALIGALAIWPVRGVR